MVRHALRTALIPLATVTALDVAGILGGAVITETVFKWNGMGEMLLQASTTRGHLRGRQLAAARRAHRRSCSTSSPTCSTPSSTRGSAMTEPTPDAAGPVRPLGSRRVPEPTASSPSASAPRPQLVLRRFLRHRAGGGQPGRASCWSSLLRLRRRRCCGHYGYDDITDDLLQAAVRQPPVRHRHHRARHLRPGHARHPAVAQDRPDRSRSIGTRVRHALGRDRRLLPRHASTRS